MEEAKARTLANLSSSVLNFIGGIDNALDAYKQPKEAKK